MGEAGVCGWSSDEETNGLFQFSSSAELYLGFILLRQQNDVQPQGWTWTHKPVHHGNGATRWGEHVRKTRLRWFRHLVTFRGFPGMSRNYILHLAWECLGIPQESLESVARDKAIWDTLLPPRQHRNERYPSFKITFILIWTLFHCFWCVILDFVLFILLYFIICFLQSLITQNAIVEKVSLNGFLPRPHSGCRKSWIQSAYCWWTESLIMRQPVWNLTTKAVTQLQSSVL